MPLPFPFCMESTLYVFFSVGVCVPFDHSLDFDISLCEISTNQPINQTTVCRSSISVFSYKKKVPLPRYHTGVDFEKFASLGTTWTNHTRLFKEALTHPDLRMQRKPTGWTTACSSMPERDGKDQGEEISKQEECSCWFIHHSRLATSGAN